MGLDMFLERRTYVRRWSHIPEDEQFLVTVTKGGKPFPDIDPERVSYVIEQVACWRKANAIHRWFVANVQNGKDDCGDYNVYPEQLRELLDLVNAVLEGSPANLLPTQDGPFFGDQEYGEGYRDDLLETRRQLEPLLAEETYADYYYTSNW